MTGQHDVKRSTLPNRYQRLKDNFAIVREEDTIRIFDAKLKIEANFEDEKWDMIADHVKKHGGDTYSVSPQIQYKNESAG